MYNKNQKVKTHYYNILLFEQAQQLIVTNPTEAKEKFKEYIFLYPKDYTAYPYYASVLITLGEFEEAEKVITFAENVAINDPFFNKDERRRKYFRDYTLSNKIRLLSYTNRYKEMYEILITHKKDIIGLDTGHIYYYCCKQLGLFESNCEKRGYLYNQIMNYSEEDFLLNIQKHLFEYQNTENINSNVFAENFPINEAILEIKKHIPYQKPLFFGFYDDTYIFKYTACGHWNFKLVDYIKVVCFHNTSDIITMVPISGCENLPFVDLDYMIKDKDYSHTRRLSQTDKFKLKYNLN